MNALRTIHAVLIDGGVVVETQPISPKPPVEVDGEQLGTVDMHVWRMTIDAVDRRIAQAIDAGLFAVELNRSFAVIDTYDNGPELVAEVKEWKGTRVSQTVARRLAAVDVPVNLHQEVRLRVLRAIPGPD